MNTPSFTTDAHRIERLRANYEAGAARERLPAQQREREECTLLTPSAQHLSSLFANVAAIQKDRVEAQRVRKEEIAAARAAA